MFTKCPHRDGGMLHACEPVTICDQFLRFVLGKDKHEFRRKPICIAFDGLIENLCLNPVKFGKIPINHNLQAANSEYARLDKVIGCRNSGACQLRIVSLREIRHIHAASQKLSSLITLTSSLFAARVAAKSGMISFAITTWIPARSRPMFKADAQTARTSKQFHRRKLTFLEQMHWLKILP